MKAIILAAVLAVSGMALAAPTEPVSSFIGEDMDGNIVTMTIPAADHGSSCPAPAPCVNGPHAYGFGFILHGFSGVSQGVYSSTLVGQDGNVRNFTCQRTTGGTSCQGAGTFPRQDFVQACAFAAASGSCILIHF